MSRQRLYRQRRRGIATLLAIVLIGLVGATLGAMTAFSAFEVRRSRALAQEAQLRQLLLAGAADVMARSQSWNESPPFASWTIEPPHALKEGAKIDIRIDSAPADAINAHITARFRSRVAQQTLRLAHSDGKWVVVTVELEG